MKTVDETLYSQVFNVQSANVNLFIEEAKVHFQETLANFYVSPVDIMIDVDKAPYNVPSALANDYKELGLWIPSNNPNAPFKALLLAWVDDEYPTPTSFRYVYLSPTNQLVMGRKTVLYSHVKNRTLDEVLTEVIF